MFLSYNLSLEMICWLEGLFDKGPKPFAPKAVNFSQKNF